jgi:hypothetical protein
MPTERPTGQVGHSCFRNDRDSYGAGACNQLALQTTGPILVVYRAASDPAAWLKAWIRRGAFCRIRVIWYGRS